MKLWIVGMRVSSHFANALRSCHSWADFPPLGPCRTLPSLPLTFLAHPRHSAAYVFCAAVECTHTGPRGVPTTYLQRHARSCSWNVFL